MRTVYVAHPFRGDEVRNAGKVAEICRRLHTEYPDTLFVSPIHAFSWFRDDHEGALQHCLWMLAKCDELWVFGEWWNSDGCKREINAAIKAGMWVHLDLIGREVG
jgi:hypothetical protein